MGRFNHHPGRILRTIRGSATLAAALLSLALSPGCSGVSSNPFRFGNLLGGDIIRTHAKPPLLGYYNNFDPAADSIKLDHAGNKDVNQVRSQHVLVASVCDKEGNGRRNRRVEWHVSGVGHIVEVDESGLFPGRGYLVDDKYAVSYTNYKPHTLTRGNENAADDVELKPGQTFCVITSDQEGETHVTAYAPGIHDWDKHKTFVIKHWIDADAILPPSATNPVGTPHDLVTQVVRHSDKSAANGYRVKYQILDGPPAVLTAPGAQPAQAIEVPIGGDGRGLVQLQQAVPAPGTNRVRIEVIRPATSPTGRTVAIASGEMVKNWVAPNLTIEKLGPELVAVGDTIEYTLRIANTGQVPTSAITVTDTIPPSLQLIGTNPITMPEGSNLIWQTSPLNPGQATEIKIVAKATAPGLVNNVAQAVANNLPVKTASKPTRVVAGKLLVTKTGPANAALGEIVAFRVAIKNIGDGPALDVAVVDTFDPRFSTTTGGPLVLPLIPRLDPGQETSMEIRLVAREAGPKLCNTVVAKARNLPDAVSAQACVEVKQPQLEILKFKDQNTPNEIYVGGTAEYRLVVRNSGRIPVKDVVVRDQLPPEMRLLGVLDNTTAESDPAANLIIWRLGEVGVNEEKTIGYKAQAVQAGRACNRAVASFGPYVAQSGEVCIDVKGVTAFNVEVLPNKNPVMVGESPTFVVKILNPGQAPIRIKNFDCSIPKNLRYESGLAPNGEALGYNQAGPNGPIAGYSPQVTVPPGKAVIFEVRTKALAPGNSRFTIGVNVEELGDKRYMQEQSITVYDPNNATQMPEVTQGGRPPESSTDGVMLSTPVRISGASRGTGVADEPHAPPATNPAGSAYRANVPRLKLLLAPAEESPAKSDTP